MLAEYPRSGLLVAAGQSHLVELGIASWECCSQFRILLLGEAWAAAVRLVVRSGSDLGRSSR
jgi:hypothetical protein